MFRNTRRIYLSGFTLIEIIVTIVVLAIASTAILSVFTSTVRTSANPMIQQQAISVAEAYMEEISLKNFNDPQGGETGNIEIDPGTGNNETRDNFDDVQDYNGLPDTVVRDQNNIAIAALDGYTVTVTVIGTALNGINAVNSMRIDVSVNHPAIGTINLSGYRTSNF